MFNVAPYEKQQEIEVEGKPTLKLLRLADYGIKEEDIVFVNTKVSLDAAMLVLASSKRVCI